MKGVWRLTGGDQRGAIFLASLVLVAIMTLLSIALFDLAMIEGALAIGDAGSSQLLSCAEAALGRSMADYTAGGRMAQISGALGTSGTTITLTPNPETVTTSSAGALTCSTTVTFTTFSPTTFTTGLLQATATAPNGTQRRVRIQLQNLSFQAWNSGDLNGQKGPYWDGQSVGSLGWSIGSYLLNTGGPFNTSPCGSSCNGPGFAVPFWGQRYIQTPDTNSTVNSPNQDYSSCLPANNCGMSKNDILFKKGDGGGGGTVVTLMSTNTAYTTNQMGWFESDATGSVPSNGCPSDPKCHPLTTNGTTALSNPGQTAQPITPSISYYGFYLTNQRGYTFYTLAAAAAAKLPSSGPTGVCAASSDSACTNYAWIGNKFTPSPIDCGQVACTPVVWQHFTVFQQNPTTYWIGVEDGWNVGWGNLCNNGVPGDGPGTSCIYRENLASCIGCKANSYVSDGDYNDWILKIVTPRGDTVVTPGADSRRWKDWQECSVSATPPSC